MLVVRVGLLASGNSSTRRPLARRYSVMPSTEVTLTGAALVAAAAVAVAAAAAGAAVVAANAGDSMPALSMMAVISFTLDSPCKKVKVNDYITANPALMKILSCRKLAAIALDHDTSVKLYAALAVRLFRPEI